MIDVYERLRSLEQARAEDRATIAELRRLIARAEQSARTGGAGGAGGSGSGRFFVGVSDGAISARSGATPGAGMVQAYQVSGGVAAAVGDPFAVSNAGAAIASGKWCGAERDIFGTIWAAPLEC